MKSLNRLRNTQLFLLDSGASFSIFTNAEFFTALHPVEDDDEMFDAQDQQIALKGKGTVTLNLGRVVRLEAYLSSDIFCDIISTPQLEKFGIYPNFETRSLRNQDGIEVAKLIKHQEVYWLSNDVADKAKHAKINKVKALTKSSKKIPLATLHESLSHINVKYIKKSVELGLIADVRTSDVDWSGIDWFNCESCMAGKGKRHNHVPNSRETYQARYSALEFLHTDIFGPMHHMPARIPKYFITFTDERTRYRWVFPLLYKNEKAVLDTFEHLIYHIHRQHGVKVKAFQMDKGSEYTNQSIRSFLASEGIDTYYTSVGDSSSHGIAERLNLTLMNDCRTILENSKMPKHLWFHAVRAACNHRNSLFNPKLGTSSRSKIGLSPIRAQGLPRFGQPCMVHDHLALKRKLKERSVPGYILRKSENSYGFLIYIPSTGRVVDTQNYDIIDRHRTILPEDGSDLEFEHSDTDITDTDESPSDTGNEQDPNKHPSNVTRTRSGECYSSGESDIESDTYQDVPMITQNIEFTPAEEIEANPDQIIAQEMRTSHISPEGGSDETSEEEHTLTFETNENQDYNQGENGEENSDSSEDSDDEEIKTNEDIFAEITKDPLPRGSRKRKLPTEHEHETVEWKRKRINYIRAMRHKKAIPEIAEKSIQYRDAITRNKSHSERNEYKAAYDKEIDQLEKHKTWDLSNPIDVHSVPASKIVSSMFIFTTKRDGRRKCRCVARGDRQKPGTYDPDAEAYTVAHEALTMCLAIALEQGWAIKQLDITSAYLYAPLKEELYIKAPPHYGLRDKVFKLNKSLYGLKQSGANWYEVIKKFLTSECELKEIKQWPCVMVRRKKEETLVVNLFVDDMIVMTSNEELYEELLNNLKREFETKVVAEGTPENDGFAKYDILGLEIEYKRFDRMLIGMEKTIIEKLPKLDLPLQGKKERFVPGQPGRILDLSNKELLLSKEEFDSKVNHMQKIVGLLSYITHKCRFEMAYYVNILAQYTLFPCDEVFELVLQCVQYLWTNKHKKLTWIRSKDNNNIRIDAIADASHATQEEYKSQLGYFYKINGHIVFARSTRSTISCVSSTEAELNALFNSFPKLKSLQQIATDLGFNSQATVFTDSQTVIASITKTDTSKFRNRFFGSKAFRLRQEYDAGEFQVEYVSTKDNTADILTKPLSVKMFQNLTDSWMK